jgi:uncharacterized membrane protein YeaQ/YmgE (transglycosylase-associated protein family)
MDLELTAKTALVTGTQAYIGFIAAVGLVGAAVGHGLVHDWGARFGRHRLTLLARAGGTVLMLGAALEEALVQRALGRVERVQPRGLITTM